MRIVKSAEIRKQELLATAMRLFAAQGYEQTSINQIIAALNKPEQFWLAIVLVNEDDSTEGPYYLQGPVSQAPDWAEVSKNLELAELLSRATHHGGAA